MDIDRFAREGTCLKGVLADYSRVVAGYPQSHRLSEGRVPVFHALTSFMPPDTGTQAEQWAREIRAVTPAERPGFIHFFGVVWFSNPTDMADTVKALNPQTYVPIRPDTMADLYRAARQ